MRNLLMRILCSAARQTRQNNPDLGSFSSETFQHELNLQFHYANALRTWLPWLNCDFNLSKRHLNREMPDIVFHKRGINALNFLVLEVKRRRHENKVPADLEQIRERWFGARLHYDFGAAVILDDDGAEFEVRLLERGVRGRVLTRTHANLDEVGLPNTPFNELAAIVDQVFQAEKEGNEAVIQPLLLQLNALVLNRFGVAPSP